MAKQSARERLKATKGVGTLLVLFIPSVDRSSKSIDQAIWVDEALSVLGRWFGGATAFPKARGVWRDDAQGGQLVFDEPVVVQCYCSETLLDEFADELRAFLVRMGEQTNQGAVGLVVDRDYLEIGFPLKGVMVVAKNIHKLATAMGARVVGQVPDVGPGAFGASRLAELIRARLSPSAGRRPGRPTDAKWVHRPKIPMSADTFQQLERLARQLSTSERKVSAMQVAAHLLEESLKVVDGGGVKL